MGESGPRDARSPAPPGPGVSLELGPVGRIVGEEAGSKTLPTVGREVFRSGDPLGGPCHNREPAGRSGGVYRRPGDPVRDVDPTEPPVEATPEPPGRLGQPGPASAPPVHRSDATHLAIERPGKVDDLHRLA